MYSFESVRIRFQGAKLRDGEKIRGSLNRKGSMRQTIAFKTSINRTSKVITLPLILQKKDKRLKKTLLETRKQETPSY